MNANTPHSTPIETAVKQSELTNCFKRKDINMEDLELLTTRIKLDYNDKGYSRNKVDFEALEADLDGLKINRRPVLMKYEDDHLIVSFTIAKDKPGLGFGK